MLLKVVYEYPAKAKKLEVNGRLDNKNAPQSTNLTLPHPKLVRGARRVESAAPRDLPCRDTLAAVAAIAHRPE
jgi:hypothetical protein